MIRKIERPNLRYLSEISTTDPNSYEGGLQGVLDEWFDTHVQPINVEKCDPEYQSVAHLKYVLKRLKGEGRE